MPRRELDPDELIEHWTVLPDEHALVQAKRGENRIGFALLLKFYIQRGRFPRGRSEIPAEAVDYVARQVAVPPGDVDRYEWDGRTIENHRAQIRAVLGFRECTVADAEVLTVWLAEQVAEEERRPEQVREALVAHCLVERIEPPTDGRIDRIVASALHRAEDALTGRISSRLSAAAARIEALVVPTSPETDEDEAEGCVLLAFIKADPGEVSLDSMLTEIERLLAVRAVGVPAGVFADVAPRVLTAWRTRAAVESPSHLRSHPAPLRLTLLAALLVAREREITDALVDLLIATVHRIDSRAEKKVTKELIREFQRVAGKESILFRMADASLTHPDEVVRTVNGGW